MKTPSPAAPERRRRRIGWIVMALLSAGVLISCVTVNRVVMVPPDIPGAEYVGSTACAECHTEVNKHFTTATHARLMANGSNAQNIGCESCHGPGSLHSESGGARGTIINPDRNPEVCFSCHLEMKGRFDLPNHHPIGDGKMSCSDCHDPHKGQATPGGPFTMASDQDTCTKCHIAQRGPFVFEHEAVREGCTACHDPHGTVNDKMLTQRSANLCLKCHFQQQTAPGQIWIGGRDHSSFLSRGTCWSAGCHEAVHGSHISSSLRF
jgi:predicted CXXCH cytochrome family protein